MAPRAEVIGIEGRVIVLASALAAESFGWQLFADKARAAAAFGYLLPMVALAMLKGGASRLLSLLCTWGIINQAAGVACVVGHEHLSSPSIGVCDEATGAPVGMAFGALLLVVLAECLRREPPP